MIMKKIEKKIILFITLPFCLNCLLSAKEEPVADFDGEYSYDNVTYSNEDILLPGLTTTVSGDSLTAGKDAVPDFSTVVHSVPNDTTLLPKLPESFNEYDETSLMAQNSSDYQRAIYAEGLIGGGYPGFFLGDFSVYKSSGTDPFLLQFSHVSANGYGQNEASDGFFDSNTKLYGEKTFTFKSVESSTSVSYSTESYGLQGQCNPYFYNMTYQTVNANEDFTWHLPHGFALSSSVFSQWYTRYAGVLPSESVTYETFEASSSAFSFAPNIEFGWNNTSFHVSCDAKYNLENLNLTEKYFVNRGAFDASFGWKNESISLDASAGVVLTQDDDGALQVIPPFEIDFYGLWRVGSALRALSVSAKAGLSSELSRTASLETEYLYTAINSIPRETSDWFGKLSLAIPLMSSFQLDVLADLRVTAFGNGVWEADYSTPFTTANLYALSEVERTMFSTDISLSYAWRLYTAKVFWTSYWGSYVPALENPFTLGLSAGAQGESGSWGVTFTYKQPLGSGVDFVPDLSLEAYFRLLDSLRLAFELSDAVKLVSGKDRCYADSMYLSRSGSATVFVRFFF